ncbi:MAG: RloB family protein, partial [Erysipelotrichaceae bacterium]
MAKRKEYNPDRSAKRKRRPVIYIVCEGQQTEIAYFKNFRTRDCLVDIVPVSSKHKAAEHLVKHSKSHIEQIGYYPKDGDQLWCVFDCDDNNNIQLRNAEEYARKNGIRIAFSNPCFEYWYLLHFEKHFGFLKDCDSVINI